MSALLCIGVPTFERADYLAQLLDALARQLADLGADIEVLVSDNASEDGTRELLRDAAARYPWLRVHRQPRNLGAVGNIEWLIEHVADAEYTWLIGDDDTVADGAVRTVADLLRRERPAWLHLPHRWIGPSGEPAGGSAAPGTVQRYATAAAMYRACHHWLTFMSASVVRSAALRAAVRETHTDNAYVPLLWFFRAGLEGPCVVAPDHLIDGGTEISWADRRHRIMTLDFTSLYDDGLHVGLSEEEFGASLDGLYANDFAFDLWQQLPIEQLAAVVGRFPQSRALRSYLWRIARAQDRRDLLGVLDRAARALGDDTTAEELLKAGEAAFAAGDAVSAAESFAAAAALMPTSATVWNDLAVTAHHLGRPNARAHIEQALFLAPDEPETLLNRSAIRLAGGDRAGARADATRVIELDPENPGARQLLAQVLG